MKLTQREIIDLSLAGIPAYVGPDSDGDVTLTDRPDNDQARALVEQMREEVAA